MKLDFLQNLESLSLDGEAFLAQFLEFLLDQSLNGNKKYDSLIWSTAQVLDLKLPISTVSSAFALLQVKIMENKQNGSTNNSNNFNQKSNLPTFQSNLTISPNLQPKINKNEQIVNGFESINSDNLQKEQNIDLDSYSNSSKKINNQQNNQSSFQNSSQDSISSSQKNFQKINSLNPDCIQKVNLEGDTLQENNSDNANVLDKIQTKTQISQNSTQNSEQNEIQNSQTSNSQNLNENSQISNNSKNISLSQVHAFLINKIKNSKEMNLKLLLTDLALEKIDLEAQTGILTLSSGALLNFLKNKKSLEWISQSLDDEFGWKLNFAALQRETKTILFSNDTVLAINKANYQGNLSNPTNILNQTSNSQITQNQNQSQNIQKEIITNNYNSISKTEPKIDKNIAKSMKQEITKTQNIPQIDEKHNKINTVATTEIAEDSEKIFYKLYSKNGDFPFNFADKSVDLISNIPRAVKEEINWEEFADEFELE